MTSASELAKFIRSKCKNKYSPHPIKLNPSFRSTYVEKNIFSTFTRLDQNSPYIEHSNPHPYFNEVRENFRLKLETLPFNIPLGAADKITLSDKHFTAETDIYWTNHIQVASFEIKDCNWEYPFANFGDIIQISVFAFLNKKITGIDSSNFIYYAPNNKLFQVEPVTFHDLLIIEQKYNYGTTLDLEEICTNYHECNCFEGNDV